MRNNIVDTYEEEKALKKAAFESFLRWTIVAEAKASIALDKDSDCHSCWNECTEYPLCPGNQPRVSA